MAKKIADKSDLQRKQASETVAAASQLVGIIPPQVLDIEQAVLGALMIEKNAILTVQDILKPDSFYSHSHQKIYKSIIDLSIALKPIDLLTVSQQLQKSGDLSSVGGAPYLATLSQNIGSASHLEFHARIVAQKYVQRQLIAASTDIQKRSFSDEYDVEELINLAEGEIFAIAGGNIRKDVKSAKEVIGKTLARIEEAAKKPDGLSGVPSGFVSVDRLTSGWQPSDLVIIAARPSMGKTAFVLTLARNMAVDHSKSVAFFSLEMSSEQLMTRLFVGESELDSDKIKNGKLDPDDWTHLTKSIKSIEASKLFIDDTPALSIFEFRSKARRLKMQYDLDIIIIDYLQLMTVGMGSGQGNREQEVAMISRSLKAIAKELDVPILALSQLSRAVESRGGSRRPQLSDLRESGAIEQDADIVAFIHRPEYYGLLQTEDGESTQGLAEIIFAKHRNGALGDIKLRFRAAQVKFTQWDNFSTERLTEVSSQGFGASARGFEDTGFDSLSASQGRVVMDNDSFDDVPF